MAVVAKDVEEIISAANLRNVPEDEDAQYEWYETRNERAMGVVGQVLSATQDVKKALQALFHPDIDWTVEDFWYQFELKDVDGLPEAVAQLSVAERICLLVYIYEFAEESEEWYPYGHVLEHMLWFAPLGIEDNEDATTLMRLLAFVITCRIYPDTPPQELFSPLMSDKSARDVNMGDGLRLLKKLSAQ